MKKEKEGVNILCHPWFTKMSTNLMASLHVVFTIPHIKQNSNSFSNIFLRFQNVPDPW
jgi:hypothetical protein